MGEIQAAPCYLFVGESGEHTDAYVEQLVKPILVKQFKLSLEEVPLGGLSSKALEEA